MGMDAIQHRAARNVTSDQAKVNQQSRRGSFAHTGLPKRNNNNNNDQCFLRKLRDSIAENRAAT